MTALGDFSSGDVLTAADLNAIGTYTDYSSSVTFSGFTKGSSTVVAKYTKVNKLVHFWGYVVTGSGSSMTGPLDISLPATAVGGFLTSNSACSFYNGSTVFWGTALNINTSTMRLVAHNATGTYAYNADVTATVPFTWTTTNYFFWNHFYEAA